MYRKQNEYITKENIYKDINPCPAEPGYILLLQTV